MIIVITQTIGLAFLPAPHAAFAYEPAVFGHQPAAQKDLLGPALDFKSFKWFIVNTVKAVFVGDDSLPFRVEDYHISVSANAQISLVGQSHHLGRIGGKKLHEFPAGDFSGAYTVGPQQGQPILYSGTAVGDIGKVGAFFLRYLISSDQGAEVRNN